MSHGCLNSYVFQQRRATCSLEIRSCTLVAIGALHPAGTGNFSSAYLLQTKGAFLEFCRKAVGTRNGGLFQRLPTVRFRDRLSAFAIQLASARSWRLRYDKGDGRREDH
jgi:hypothetical protein